ncbi:MAG: glutathione S-transferase family protein, partial [Deltaproteobacteria bacterium]
MKLFYAPNTIALASMIILEEVGATYTPQLVDFKVAEQRQPEYLALNPKGRVPALVTDQGLLTETPAILSYVAGLHGLTPSDPFKAAQVEEWNAYLCSTVHVSHAHGGRGHRWSDDASVIEGMKVKVAQNMSDHFAYLESRFVGPFVFGETFTTSDAYTYTIARWLERDGADPLAHLDTRRRRV